MIPTVTTIEPRRLNARRERPFGNNAPDDLGRILITAIADFNAEATVPRARGYESLVSEVVD